MRVTVSPLLSHMIRKIVMICTVSLLFTAMVYAGEKRTTVPIGDSPSIGPENAPVTIIEFIDFQ